MTERRPDQCMSKEHFLPLDGLRGVAILLVILVHTFSYKGSSLVGRGLESFARAGWVGVTLFFVLSGFLITGILIDTRGKKNYLRDFFARRSLRIFPLYFAFIILYFYAVPHIPLIAEQLPLPKPDLWIYYWTYTANMQEWLSGITSSIKPLDPLWSLAVEEQVYLFWPFLILLVPRRRLILTFVGMALLSFTWRFLTRLTAQSVALSYGWAPANLEAFAIGAIVALCSREHRTVLRAWSPRIAMASGCFILGLWIGQKHFTPWYAPVPMLTIGMTGMILFSASTIGVSITSKEQSLINRLLSLSGLRSLGKYSYAIYLFHAAVIEVLSPLFFSERTGIKQGENLLISVLFTIGVVGISYIIARVSWYVWESRFLRLKTYFPLSGRGAVVRT
jgi:peptidoglycan/LPS O-acetylase OafA/YrhL